MKYQEEASQKKNWEKSRMWKDAEVKEILNQKDYGDSGG